jgi:hypothetical protein
LEIGSRFVFAALDKEGTPYAGVISIKAFDFDHIGPRSAKVWPIQVPARMRASSMTFRPYNRMFILIPCFYTVSRRIHVFAANIQAL